MMVAPTRANALALIGALTFSLVLVSLIALTIGGVHVPISQLWQGLMGSNPGAESTIILRDIRLPRSGVRAPVHPAGPRKHQFAP